MNLYSLATAVMATAPMSRSSYHLLVSLHTLQLYLCRKLPSRALSHSSGRLARAYMPRLLRRPLFGVFVRLFGCNMAEAVEQDLQSYPNFHSLFTRSLKHEVRPIALDKPLVSGRLDSEGVL